MDFARRQNLRLAALAAALLALWWLASPAVSDPAEQALWQQVRAAQAHVAAWRGPRGDENDPWGCGLIGVEWSGITTTLGSLEAKRTACDPAWAVRFSRWYAELGLAPGDPVAIYSSASFPGMLLNAVTAAEAAQLDILLVVSLGASTWGANDPDYPWPVLAAELRRAGFLRTRADYYTLGGGGETGQGMAPEGAALLRRAADAAGVEVLAAPDLAGMVARKTDLLHAHGARLLVSIGGSQANLGDDPGVLRLMPGLHRPGRGAPAGNGVIARALQGEVPALHLLDLRSLAARSGIPFDRPPSGRAPGRAAAGWSLAGLSLFLLVVLTHRRWRLV